MFACAAKRCVVHYAVAAQVRALSFGEVKFDVTQEVKVKELIATLSKEERQLLYNKLRQVLLEEERLKRNYAAKPQSKLMAWFASKSGHFSKYIVMPTGSQLTSLFAFHSLPYLAFGCLDNCIMILAGDYIETSIGAAIGKQGIYFCI